MINIIERKRENKSIYELQTCGINDKAVFSEIINYETVTFKHPNGFMYLILFDEDMKPIQEIFSYLNKTIASFSINSRIKYLNALRLLYIFQHIIYKNVTEFNVTDVNNLKYFLRGLSPAGQVFSLKCSTKRSNETINGYLSVYRQFLTFLECTNSYLFKIIKGKKSIDTTQLSSTSVLERYAASEYNTKNQRLVPYYISVFEFKDILLEIRKNHTLCEECITRLMYEGGLRLGEVLGLTFDDITSEIIEGKKEFVVYIRNRVSDNKDQHAKTCMKVTNIEQYKSEEYQTKNYGYQTIQISENLYSKINDYIEKYHAYVSETKSSNYHKVAIADRVRKSVPYENDNYYVFLNSLGKPLSYQTWNNTLRKILTSVNIPIDKEKRKHNLSHRFRHGFAMFNVKYMKANILQLKVKMRHQNITTVSIYFRPTISDEIEIKTQFSEELYKIISELNI